MRGEDERSGTLFSYVDLEAQVGQDHLLRTIGAIVNEAFAALAGVLDAVLADGTAVDPAREALASDALASVRLDPLGAALMDRLEFDLLFRRFVGTGVDDAAWDHSAFSKNRERLLEGDIAAKLLSAVLAQPRVKRLLSTDHFSVDGTLIEVWVSMKSFKPRDGSDEPLPDGGGRNKETDLHGQKRSNKTHASTTDPERGSIARGLARRRSCASWACADGQGPCPHRAGRRTAQALQAGHATLRKDRPKLQINRLLRRRYMLDQIRPHGLG